MRITLLTLIIIFSFSSCANKKIVKEVNQEITKTPIIKSDNELYSIENKMLLSNKELSETQRNNLQSLILKMKSQNVAIENDIMKVKAVLFQTLIEPNKSKIKLNILENQLLKLNRKKIRNSLSAYREARNIVGKNEIPLSQTLEMIDNRTINKY